MAGVVPLGGPLSAGAGQEGGAHDQAPSGGILTAVVAKVTNARAESINAGIQKVKYSACGFRNRKRFRNAIYVHLGGLDLYPASVTP